MLSSEIRSSFFNACACCALDGGGGVPLNVSGVAFTRTSVIERWKKTGVSRGRPEPSYVTENNYARTGRKTNLRHRYTTFLFFYFISNVTSDGHIKRKRSLLIKKNIMKTLLYLDVKNYHKIFWNVI